MTKILSCYLQTIPVLVIEDGITPDNQIQNTGEASSGTKQVFFDYNASVTGTEKL